MRGDIWRWDGKRRTRVYHGVIPISQIAGSKNRGFAVGPDGLTVVLQSWPSPER